MRQTPKRAEITLWRNNLQDTQHCSAHTPNGHECTKYIFQKYRLKYLKYITFAIFAPMSMLLQYFRRSFWKCFWLGFQLMTLLSLQAEAQNYKNNDRHDSSLSHIRHDASSSDSSLPSYGSCLVLLVSLCCCRDFPFVKGDSVLCTELYNSLTSLSETAVLLGVNQCQVTASFIVWLHRKINQYSLIVPAAHTVVEPPAVMVEVRHTLVTGATMFRLRSPETTTYIYLCLQLSAA